MIFVRVLVIMWRATRRFWGGLSLIIIALLVALNLATLTVSAVFATASGVISAVGLSTVAARAAVQPMQASAASRRIARDTAQRVTQRVQRGVVRNIGSVSGEAIPVIGIGVIAGALALEVKDACDTARDMTGLEAALASPTNADTARDIAVASFDCVAMIRERLPNYKTLPTKEDIWATTAQAPAKAYEAARDVGINLAEINWSGQFAQTVDVMMDFAGTIKVWFEIPTSVAK